MTIEELKNWLSPNTIEISAEAERGLNFGKGKGKLTGRTIHKLLLKNGNLLSVVTVKDKVVDVNSSSFSEELAM